MIGQLFYKRKLISTINPICIKYLKKNVEIKSKNLINNCDKYNLIARHFIYLLRLNKLEEKEYKDHVILLKLIIIYHHSQLLLKAKLSDFDLNKIKMAMEDLTNKLNLPTSDYCIEKKPLTTFLPNFENIDFDSFYCQIANIFNSINRQDKAYYEYGYYLTMLFNLQIIKTLNNNECNLSLYKLKLTIVDQCILAIAKIDVIQFNNFIRNYNKTLKKISKKSKELLI